MPGKSFLLFLKIDYIITIYYCSLVRLLCSVFYSIESTIYFRSFQLFIVFYLNIFSDAFYSISFDLCVLKIHFMTFGAMRN